MMTFCLGGLVAGFINKSRIGFRVNLILAAVLWQSASLPPPKSSL